MANDKDNRFSRLIALILADEGKTSVFSLGKEVGYSREDVESKVIHKIFSFAKYAKTKSMTTVKSVKRTDAKATIATVLEKISLKMLEKVNNPKEEFLDDFMKVHKLFMQTFAEYTKFEGLNKADKLEIEVKTSIDTKKLTAEDAEKLLLLYNKGRVEQE